MILTNCAACAAPLPHDAPRCVRCHTRYCNQTCQHDHWRRGHKQICKRIHRGGNAEQCNADKRYKEAVAVAVEACADDTKGQKCYICLEAVHSRTGEGLVRGCACGDRDGVSSPELGVAHVSCLVRQAKILLDEEVEKKISGDAVTVRWGRWHTCSLCEQEYHGVVRCAIAWGCWRTYLGRPEADQFRTLAMGHLSTGLRASGQIEEALRVMQAACSTMRRYRYVEENILAVEANIAAALMDLGHKEEALRKLREIYAACLRRSGPRDPSTLHAANNFAGGLGFNKKWAEARQFLRRQIPLAEDTLGRNSFLTLKIRHRYAITLRNDVPDSVDDLTEALKILEDVARRSRRVLGNSHPFLADEQSWIENTQEMIRQAELASIQTQETAKMRLEDVDAPQS